MARLSIRWTMATLRLPAVTGRLHYSFQNGNAVRMPIGQLKWLLEMCDEHYDNIKFAVEMYMRANRDEIGTIE